MYSYIFFIDKNIFFSNNMQWRLILNLYSTAFHIDWVISETISSPSRWNVPSRRHTARSSLKACVWFLINHQHLDKLIIKGDTTANKIVVQIYYPMIKSSDKSTIISHNGYKCVYLPFWWLSYKTILMLFCRKLIYF